MYARTPLSPAQGADNSSSTSQEVETDTELAAPDDPESGAPHFQPLATAAPKLLYIMLCTQVKASILRDLAMIQIR